MTDLCIVAIVRRTRRCYFSICKGTCAWVISLYLPEMSERVFFLGKKLRLESKYVGEVELRCCEIMLNVNVPSEIAHSLPDNRGLEILCTARNRAKTAQS